VASPQEIFHRDLASGWILASRDIPRLGGSYADMPEKLLGKMDLSRPSVCLAAGDVLTPELEGFLEDLETLFNLPVGLWRVEEEPPTELAGAGLMVLVGGSLEEWISALDNTQLGELVISALNQGGVILAVEWAAASLGTWAFPTDGGEPVPGLAWLPGALVLPYTPTEDELGFVRSLLERQPKAYALGLTEASVVAFGPGGEIEIWGEEQPRLILGTGWSSG
jgi:hypothetical protein